MKVAICFAQFGPYHHARVRMFQAMGNFEVLPVQLASTSTTYAWDSGMQECQGLQTLCAGNYESLKPLKVLLQAWSFFSKEKIGCALLPSYAPAAETALLIAAKLAGVRCVMMNESHAGTERATGWKKQIKGFLVKRFDAALVGGQPQKRYFAQLGIPKERIFTGYDAIDNDYFATAAASVREDAANQRKTLGLPDNYFLSLGRMVEKKNLSCLINAYAQFAAKAKIGANNPQIPSLVFVGSGAQKDTLKKLCTELELDIVDTSKRDLNQEQEDELNYKQQTPGVFFYGFRQIEENPVFYALADAFILPSLWEEWGLVVNEAMACSLPVIVSQTVGSAEDLVVNGENGYTFDPLVAEQLASHLETLHANPELRLQMGKRSKEIISNWGCDNFARNAIAAVECAMRKA
jgi:glycosyltransferase involved in cell wall biosynthesis